MPNSSCSGSAKNCAAPAGRKVARTTPPPAFLPSYAGAGVGLTIQIFDGGPFGPKIAEGRRPLLDIAIGLGFVDQNFPQEVDHSCKVSRGPGSTFLTSKVELDTYATTVGAQAVGRAGGRVTTIRYLTCQ